MKPYSEMTPAERLAYRIQINREIDAKVEKNKEVAKIKRKIQRLQAAEARWNDDKITQAINHFRVEVGMSPIVTFRTNRGIF